MAEKRMFSKKITDSDAFIEMSSAAQALYFHLNQGADDDGFNNQIQMSMIKAHASVDDLKVLLVKNFIIRFESGVIVIKHWRMHNTLRSDRYHPTNYKEELKMLGIKDNGTYTLNNDVGCQMVANRLPNGCPSIDKISIDKNSKEETNNINIISKEEKSIKGFIKPTLDDIKAYCKEKKLSVDCEKFFAYYESNGWKVGKNPMKNWKASLNFWQRNQEEKKSSFGYVDDDPTLI